MKWVLRNIFTCDSPLASAGPLLDAVQMSALYPDSKTFVDKKLKHSPGKIIKRFEELVKGNDGKSLTKEQIKEVSRGVAVFVAGDHQVKYSILFTLFFGVPPCYAPAILMLPNVQLKPNPARSGTTRSK